EVRPQDQLAQPVLRVRVVNGADEREVPPLAMDGERPRGERDDAPAPVAPLPDGKANELEAIELAASEVDLGVGELAGGRGSIGAQDLDRGFHGVPPLMLGSRTWRGYCGARASGCSGCGARRRIHSQCCSVFAPTRTGSAGAKRCCASRQRARCQVSSVASTRTSRAGV